MLNRTLCDVLEAMRKCQETHNYSYLAGLIEEAQNMGNRMEAGLYDKHDLDNARKEYKKTAADLKKLKEELTLLKDKKKNFLSQNDKKALKNKYKSAQKEET